MLGSYVDLGNPVADHPLNAGLVAWWLGLPNNSGGGTLFDLCGQRPATLTNGPAWSPSPGGFAGLSLDGTDDYAVADPFRFDPATSGYTYSAWIKPAFASSSGTRRGLICWRAGGIVGGDQSRVRLIWLDGSSGFYLDDKARYAFSGKPSFASGEAHHIAFTRTAAGGGQYYWDGSPLSTTTVIDLGGIEPANTYPIYIGLDSENSAAWSGGLWDTRVYSRALTAADHAGLYDQGRRGHPDTLRRYRPWVAVLGAAAGGGGGGSAVGAARHHYVTQGMCG